MTVWDDPLGLFRNQNYTTPGTPTSPDTDQSNTDLLNALSQLPSAASPPPPPPSGVSPDHPYGSSDSGYDPNTGMAFGVVTDPNSPSGMSYQGTPVNADGSPYSPPNFPTGQASQGPSTGTGGIPSRVAGNPQPAPPSLTNNGQTFEGRSVSPLQGQPSNPTPADLSTDTGISNAYAAAASMIPGAPPVDLHTIDPNFLHNNGYMNIGGQWVYAPHTDQSLSSIIKRGAEAIPAIAGTSVAKYINPNILDSIPNPKYFPVRSGVDFATSPLGLATAGGSGLADVAGNVAKLGAETAGFFGGQAAAENLPDKAQLGGAVPIAAGIGSALLTHGAIENPEIAKNILKFPGPLKGLTTEGVGPTPEDLGRAIGAQDTPIPSVVKPEVSSRDIRSIVEQAYPLDRPHGITPEVQSDLVQKLSDLQKSSPEAFNTSIEKIKSDAGITSTEPVAGAGEPLNTTLPPEAPASVAGPETAPDTTTPEPITMPGGGKLPEEVQTKLRQQAIDQGLIPPDAPPPPPGASSGNPFAEPPPKSGGPVIDQIANTIRQTATLGHYGIMGLRGFMTGMTDLPAFLSGLKDTASSTFDTEALANADAKWAAEQEAKSPGITQKLIDNNAQILKGGSSSSEYAHTPLEKLPVGGKIIQGYQNGIEAMQQSFIKSKISDLIDSAIKKNGGAPVTDSQAAAIAKYANEFALTTTKSSGELANIALFGPRMMLATAKLPLNMFSGEAVVRNAAIRDLSWVAATTASATLGLNYAMSGGKDIWGPGLGKDIPQDREDFSKLVHQSNFMKINVGNQKLSLFGPFDSIYRTGFKVLSDMANQTSPGTDIKTFVINHLSPLFAIGADIVAGHGYNNSPVTWKNELSNHVQPIAIGDIVPIGKDIAKGDYTSAGAQAAEYIAGVKGVDQTPYDTRDTTAQSMFGKQYNQLNPLERQQVNDANGGKIASTNPLTQTISKADEAAKAVNTQKQTYIDQTYDGKSWRDQYHLLEQNILGQKQQDDRIFKADNPNYVSPYGSAMDTAINDYYTQLDASVKGNNPDYSVIDQWRIDHPDEAKLVDQYLASKTNTDLSPKVTQYKTDSAAVANSGYFDIGDAVWNQISKNSPTLSAFKTYSDYESSPHPASSVSTAYSNLRESKVIAWIKANPDAAKAAVTWNYLTPTKAEKAILGIK